jgi:hypothetical protein
MGYLTLRGVISTGCHRKIALRWHLSCNCEPAIPTYWVDCCDWVIERAIAGEGLEVSAPVPAGFPPFSAREIFRELRLEAWVDAAVDEERLRQNQILSEA